jgi:hypothetical protein
VHCFSLPGLAVVSELNRFAVPLALLPTGTVPLDSPRTAPSDERA